MTTAFWTAGIPNISLYLPITAYGIVITLITKQLLLYAWGITITTIYVKPVILDWLILLAVIIQLKDKLKYVVMDSGIVFVAGHNR